MKDKPTALPAKLIADKTSNSAGLLHGVKHSEGFVTISSERNYTQPIWGAVGGQHVGNYWEFYSLKLRRCVGSYSDLEYDHNVLIEVGPEVEIYCEQPIRAQAYIYGEMRWSRLDSWVKFKDGTDVFREVKYSRDLAMSKEGDRLDIQLKIQRQWAERNGVKHEVVTEKTIRAKPILLQNWKRMLQYLTMHRGMTRATEAEVAALTACVTATRPLPIWVLIDRFAPQMRAWHVRRIVFELLLAGSLSANLEKEPMGDKCLVCASKS